MSPSPEDIARDFRIPEMGRAPPLRQQFPGADLHHVRSAIDLLRAEYVASRSAWEGKWQVLFPELVYDQRVHPIEERPAVVALRCALVKPEEFQFAGTSAETLTAMQQALTDQEDLTLELQCIARWMMQQIIASCGAHKIPIVTSADDGSTAKLQLAKSDPLDVLPPLCREKALRARSAYTRRVEEFEQAPNFKHELGAVTYSLARCDALAYQYSYLSSLRSGR